jgi:hypothetical protein
MAPRFLLDNFPFSIFHFPLNVAKMDRLVEVLSGELDGSMKEVVGRAIVRDGLWAEAIGLASHPDARVAFRAAWALEWAYFSAPEGLLPHIDIFVEAFLKSDNGSVHREYLKILCDIQCRRIVEFDDIQRVRIVEKAFDLLISPATKPGVKVWCMDILSSAPPHLDWVGEALTEALHRILESDPSPGLANRASKVLRKLRR